MKKTQRWLCLLLVLCMLLSVLPVTAMAAEPGVEANAVLHQEDAQVGADVLAAPQSVGEAGPNHGDLIYENDFSGEDPISRLFQRSNFMKTILVLGGAGYIGSHTVYELIDNGYDVVVADNLETGFRKAVHPKARFYQGDIRNKEFCDHVFSSEKIDAVIHFAANSQVGESMVNPIKYYDNNLGGTRTMLQSMIEHGVKYIVFSSTAATYGEPERVPILETDPTHPTNCYGETKLSMERMFYWASVAHGIHFVALRYFNACGAHMSGKIGEAHNPETHLIPIVLQVPNGQRDHVSIFGDDYPTRDGTCVRDYIHVTDLASAHILAAEYLMNGGENNVFNLGNGVGSTVKEIIDTAEKVVGKPIKCEMAARRAGDPAQLVASSEKAKTVLGWKPKYDDIESIIGSAWNWHKEHPYGYED